MQQCHDRTYNSNDETSAINEHYCDVLRILSDRGYSAMISNTGGGCFALVIEAAHGQMLLITDRLGPLVENRREQSGWGIGVYADESCNELIFYQEVTQSTGAALAAALDAIPDIRRSDSPV